jgi:ubiquitin-protein ligase
MNSNDSRRLRHAQTPPKEGALFTPTSLNSLQKFIRDCLSPEYHSLVTSNDGDRGENHPNSSSNPHLYSSPPRVPFSLQEEREQALRDYKVTIEYKHLKSHAPGGVYLVPSMDNLRHFFGVIFVRRGPFTNGIFKFSLKLPLQYNDTNMWPQIVFSSHVFNPYVDEKTGELDIQSAYPTWDPSRHYLVTVLTYLKKIFYSKNFTDARANPQARELAENDTEAYRQKVDECVRESQKNVYINEKGSTAQFTEEQVSHRVLRDLLKHHISSENQVTKQAVLTQVEKARKV